MDNITRITTQDADGVTFATRHTWIRLYEEDMPENYVIVSSMVGTSGIYHVLQNNNPINFLQEQEDFKLLKYTVDEETGKIVAFGMGVSKDEAVDFINHERRLSWELLEDHNDE